MIALRITALRITAPRIPALLLGLLGPVLFGAVTLGAAELPHLPSEIPLGGALLVARHADVDGDARLDMVFAVRADDGRRRIVIHLLRPDGRFAAEPDRSIEIKSDTIAWSLADLDPAPGMEVLLLTKSSVFGYRTAETKTRKAVWRIARADFLCDLPDPRELPYLECVHSLGVDEVSLILPTPNGYAVWGRSGATDAFESRGTVPARAPTTTAPGIARGSVTIGIGSGPPPPEAGGQTAFVKGAGAEGVAGGSFLATEAWLPAITAADFNGDGRLDLWWVDERVEPATLRVHLQDAKGAFATEASWSGPAPAGESLQVVDLDGDGAADVVAEDADGVQSQRLRLFRNRGGAFDFETTDQLFKFEAFGIQPAFIDVDGDSRVELAVTSYGLPSKLDVLSASIERKLLLYGRDPKGKDLFARRTASTASDRMGAAQAQAFDHPLRLGGDFDGDGRHEWVAVDDEGALVVRPIGDRLELDRSTRYRFVPRLRIRSFWMTDLNGDGCSDLILEHRGKVQLLVSRPKGV